MKKIFSIGLFDTLKGFFIAAGGVFLAGLLVFLQATPPHLPTPHDLGLLGLASLGCGVSYLVKNFFTNSENKFAKPEPKKEDPKQ